MKLVRKTTGQVIYDVDRREYPNRLGYYFGASVSYIGKTEAGEKIEISAKERSKYVEGFSVGDFWKSNYDGVKSYIKTLDQLTKNIVKVSYQYHLENGEKSKLYEDEIEGRIVK